MLRSAPTQSEFAMRSMGRPGPHSRVSSTLRMRQCVLLRVPDQHWSCKSRDEKCRGSATKFAFFSPPCCVFFVHVAFFFFFNLAKKVSTRETTLLLMVIFEFCPLSLCKWLPSIWPTCFGVPIQSKNRSFSLIFFEFSTIPTMFAMAAFELSTPTHSLVIYLSFLSWNNLEKVFESVPEDLDFVLLWSLCWSFSIPN